MNDTMLLLSQSLGVFAGAVLLLVIWKNRLPRAKPELVAKFALQRRRRAPLIVPSSEETAEVIARFRRAAAAYLKTHP